MATGVDPITPSVLAQVLASGSLSAIDTHAWPPQFVAALQLALQGSYAEALERLDQVREAKVLAFQDWAPWHYLRCRCLIASLDWPALPLALDEAEASIEPSCFGMLQARVAIAKGQAEAALEWLKPLGAKPLDWEALALLAILAPSAEQAESRFAQSLQLFPQQADTLRNRAVFCLKQNRLPEAIADLQAALAVRPGYAPALELLHPLLVQSGQIQSLQAHYSHWPDWGWTPKLAGLHLGLLQALGKPDQAWQEAQQALVRWPGQADLILCAAAAAQAAGQRGRAQQLYRQLQQPGCSPALAARALNNLALLAVDDNDLPQALELMAQACRLEPHDADLLLQRAELLLRNGEQDAAADLLAGLQSAATALSLAQQRRWLLAQSRLLQKQGDLPQALSLAQQARQQGPGLADTWLQEAAVLSELQRVDEGVQLILQAAGQVEQPRQLRDPLLSYMLKQGRLQQAGDLLQQWLQQDPHNSDLLAQQAGLLMDLGQFAQAEQQLRQLAAREPQRGRIALVKFLIQRDRPAEALALCRDAIAADPQRLVPYQLAAQALVLLQRWPEALECLHTARAQDPERLDVLSELIRLQLQHGESEAAMALLEAEMARQPRLALLRMALQVLQRSGQWQRGLALLRPLEQVDPANPELQLLKSRLLRRSGQAAPALAITQALVHANPANLRLREAHIRELLIQEHYAAAQQQAYALAAQLPESPQRLLQLVKLLKLADAPEQALAEAQQQRGRWPGHPELLWMEVDLLDALSRFPEAQATLDAGMANTPPSAQLLERASAASLRHRHYDAAMRYAVQWQQLQPDNISALWQVFHIFDEQNQYADALRVLEQIQQRYPTDPRLDPTAAGLLARLNRYSTAIKLLDRAIEHQPSSQELRHQRLVLRTSAGDFSRFDAELAELDRLRGEDRYRDHHKYFFNINCHPGWSAERVYAFHRDWYEKAVAPDLPAIPAYPAEQFDPGKRLKIGYVSGDFKRHAVAYFSEPFLIEHDREQFELYAFATHNPAESSATTERFRSYVHHWIDAYGMDDGELYRKIRSLGIDILVDLSGHTSGSRLMVFARKPAPLQFSAVFGAGQTTGIARIDYFLCDQVAVPPDHAPFLSERRAELPFAGLPYKPGEDFIDPVPLPCAGGAPFTFACVTRPVRVADQVCAVWGSILAACPSAQLVFEHSSYEEPEVQERYRSLLVAAGAQPEQILFRNTRPYWQLFHQVDLLLDPWPAGSGTVGTDALWMNRATLTLASRPVMGRAMAAQLTALGLEQPLVCWDLERYHQRAVEFATTAAGREELIQLSAGLRERLQQSHLMDYKAYGQAAAALYRRLWVERCQQEQLQPAASEG